jgi:hypothetical protein
MVDKFKTFFFWVFCSFAGFSRLSGWDGYCEEDIKIASPVQPARQGVCLELLYFEAIEDSILYADKVPQNSTYRPVIKTFEQNPSWSPGFRLSFDTCLSYNNWEVGTNYTFYYNHPHRVHKTSDDFSIFGVLVIPAFGINGNSFAKEVHGSWDLMMNVFDLVLKKSLWSTEGFAIKPLGGIKACIINQKMKTTYKNFRIDFPQDTTPQKMTGKNDVWGIGMQVGAEMRYELPAQFSLFFNANFSCLWGLFNLKTVYKDMLNSPSKAKISVKDNKHRIFPSTQIQTGFSKEWEFKSNKKVGIALGWEMQIWWRQLRMNWFSTLVTPPDGSDLTLNGPFLGLWFNF